MLISQTGNDHPLFLLMRLLLWIFNYLNTLKSYSDSDAKNYSCLSYMHVKIPLSDLNTDRVPVWCACCHAAGPRSAVCNRAGTQEQQCLQGSPVLWSRAWRHRGEELERAGKRTCLVSSLDCLFLTWGLVRTILSHLS